MLPFRAGKVHGLLQPTIAFEHPQGRKSHESKVWGLSWPSSMEVMANKLIVQ